MQTTMTLLDRALEIEPAQHWHTRLKLNRNAFHNARIRQHLSPAITGALEVLRRPTLSSHSHCTHSHTPRTRIRTTCLHVFVSTRCVYVGSVSTWLAWVGRLRVEVGVPG